MVFLPEEPAVCANARIEILPGHPFQKSRISLRRTAIRAHSFVFLAQQSVCFGRIRLIRIWTGACIMICGIINDIERNLC